MPDEVEGGTPDLRAYGRTLWRHRWLIVLPTLIAVAAAIALSATSTRIYEATTQVIIQPSTTEQILGSTVDNAQQAARNVDTEVAVLKSSVVRDAAEDKLGYAPEIRISSSATSDVVSVTARSKDARRAATDANSYAQTYVDYRHNQTVDDLLQAGEQINAKLAVVTSPEQRTFLQQQLDQLQVAANLNGVGGARVLAEADEPGGPVEPRPLRNAGIALILGLLLGVGLAFLREYLDDSVSSREDLQRAVNGPPVLGLIPRVSGWRDKGSPYVVTIEEPASAGSEAYRTLRTSMQFLSVDRKLRSIQVTSSGVSEGKTTTVANLAIAFAQAGRRVAVVCCDLRRPRIHTYFDLPNKVGFTSLLLGETTVHEALQPAGANLYLLSAGPTPPNPSELLSTARAREVIGLLEDVADLVIIDSAPVLPVSDALIVSGLVDATLLVAAANESSRRGVRRAIELLQQVDAPLVGSVLNMVKPSDLGGGDGNYGYGYAYGADNGAGKQSRTLSRRKK